MTISKEFKIGLLTIVAVTVLFWGYNYLLGINYFNPTNNYFVVYNEIGGLEISNQVMIQGYKAGRVKNIILRPDEKKVVVEIEIEDDIQLGDQTIALLADDGFLGGKIIHLKTSKKKDYFSAGDTLFSKTDEGISDMVKSKTDPIVRSLDSTLNKVTRLLDEYKGMSADVRRIMHNIEEASGSLDGMLKDNRQSISSITKNIEQLSSSLVQTEKKLAPLLDKLNSVADSVKSMELAQVTKNLNQNLVELRGITSSINKGEGTLGLLIKSDTVHQRIDSLLLTLNSVLLDLKQSPKKYLPPISVFGKKDKTSKKKE